MKIIHTQKFVLMSPRKLRRVADLARDLSPERAIEVLPHVERRAAGPLVKAINAAVANAKQKGVDGADLVFSHIQINEGPRLKRGRPVSRGQWHPYKRRMSHIRIVLETKSQDTQSHKAISKSEDKDKKMNTKKVEKKKVKSDNKQKRASKKGEKKS